MIIGHTKRGCPKPPCKTHAPKRMIFLAIFVGLLVAVGFILIERIIISTQLHKLNRISAFITQKMWFFLGTATEKRVSQKAQKRAKRAKSVRNNYEKKKTSKNKK